MFKTYDAAKKAHPDIDEWAATTVFEEFPDNADAILAGTVCEETFEPWEHPSVFEKVALCINDRPMFSDMHQDLSTKEMAYAVKMLKQRYPEDHFNDEVAAYIAATAAEEGFCILPEILNFAQHLLPLAPLDRSQEAMQELYLREVDDYLEVKNDGR